MKPTSLLQGNDLRPETGVDSASGALPASGTPASRSLAAGWTRTRRWLLANTFMPSRWPKDKYPRAGAYLLALTLQALAAVATLLVAHLFPTFSFPDALGILAIALAAFTWGAAPSLAATLLGVWLLEAVILPHLAHGPISHAGDVVEIVVYLSVGGIVSVVASQTERARQRAVREFAAAHARELALREVNDRTDEFLSIASHELRSPLTSLKLALQMSNRRLVPLAAHDEPAVPPAAADISRRVGAVVDLLQTAEQQVHRQERLIGDLLDVSRIRANRLEMRFASCDLAAVIREAVEEQRLAWPERTITLDLADEQLSTVADAHRLGQVVTNVLTTALKYSPADAPVAVSLTWAGNQARVAVRDCGPGLSADQRAHIWDRFHSVPGIKQQSGSGAGLGLGLYICRTIVERHRGEVGVDSKPGKGSTFWFTLPLAGTPGLLQAAGES